jgi:hypothetical protein
MTNRQVSDDPAAALSGRHGPFVKMDARGPGYERHLADTRARLEVLLAPVCPTLPIDLRPSPLDDGFRGQARFSVSETDGTVSVTGVDPLAGRAPWASTLWILPGFGQRLAKTIIGKIWRDHSRYTVRGFDLRLCCGTRRAHVVVAVDRSERVSFGRWAEELLQETPAVSGVTVPSQRLTVGDPLIRHRLLGREILAHPRAFFQTNYWLTEQLFQHIASALSRVRAASVLDLYCGVGVHSLLAGDHNTRTTGVDSDRHAIAVARQNADDAGRPATFEHAPVEVYLARGSHADCDAAIVNPPRSGCGAGVVEGVTDLTPRCICLVCCSAEAQVRDLHRFRELGYEATEYTAFDMFPFTRFVENVTMLFPR